MIYRALTVVGTRLTNFILKQQREAYVSMVIKTCQNLMRFYYLEFRKKICQENYVLR